MNSSRFVLGLALILGLVAWAAVWTDPSSETVGAEPERPAPAAAAGFAAPAAGQQSVRARGERLAAPHDEGRSAAHAGRAQTQPESQTAQQDERTSPTLEELLEFREFVDATLEQIRGEEAQESRLALERRRLELDARMQHLEAELGLSAPQSDRLRSLLLARLEREAEYVWLREHGAEEQALSELQVSDRASERGLAAGFLSEWQLARFLALPDA